MTLADAFEQIEAALHFPDERVHHARQALASLPEDHPAGEPLADGLAGEVDLEPALRTAYGELPPGPDDDPGLRPCSSKSAPAQTDPDTSVDDEPPVGVEWVDEDHALVGLELTRPIVEWIELEKADDYQYGVEGWIRHILYVHLRRNLQQHHGFSADVEVDVPEDFARRVSLWARDRRLQGEDVDAARVEDFAFNHMDWDPTWRLDGEPWLLAEAGAAPPESADDGRADQ